MVVEFTPGLSMVVHVLAFGGAATACFVSIGRARRIDDPDTRRGLIALLATSGGWATAHVMYLVVPTVTLKAGFYVVGLIVGLAAVGPWLYFCSAYTGRSLHRVQTLRHLAVGLFLVLVAVKVTNPFHQLYFTAELVQTPFPHLAVNHGIVHWLVMGLSYALATVGYFMLLELFLQVSYDTRPFVGLLAVTGLPILFDVIGLVSPALIDITYEPLGVAVFAVGILFAYQHRFQAIRLAGGRDEPVIIMSDEAHIRDFNSTAAELFPDQLTPDAVGRPLADVIPTVAEAIQTGNSLIELDRNELTRYYRLTNNPFTAGQTRLGGLITLTDITHREEYRRELERQNERLDQFADMISHDLRNPLNVADGHLELARQDHDSDHLATVATALDRMEALIEDVLTLARQGQPIDEPELVDLRSIVNQCWDVVETADADLVVDDDLKFLADPERLQQLLENLVRNAIEHGGSTITIRVGTLGGDDGFFIADDGPGIPPDERGQVFESGYSTADDGTGFGLAIVMEIVDAHGWKINVTDADEGGARFEVTGVTTRSSTDPMGDG